uniref:Uncharacterized protein n=1 Tax=Anguilla anguilla TaxID=7936 RepID=A0A0E9RJD1_ANGAN
MLLCPELYIEEMPSLFSIDARCFIPYLGDKTVTGCFHHNSA